MEVNEYQVGGKHYEAEYQHWDFVEDIGLPYLLGCATKYPFRWRDKNGVEDLRKSIHYIQKAESRGIYGLPKFSEGSFSILEKFINQPRLKGTVESIIIHRIVIGDYDVAIKFIEDLIREEETK